MPSAAFDLLIKSFFGTSPYEAFAGPSGNPAPPGWGHDSPVFERLIAEVRPTVIVEVGTWLGASAIRMADLLEQGGVDAAIVCVDTWLGSPIHWQEDDYRRTLDLVHGYPRLYYAFLANVIASGHSDTIVPLPQTSENAARMLARLNLQPQLVYIDGDHEATAVFADLTNYWPLVAPGGVMFGDDFIADWPGVVRAVQLFAEKVGLRPEVSANKWILRKSAS
jgi:hypothetical protein